ncbi:MAG: Sua5/YciO/YrdC/YwlC family protein [Tannerella sp.]|jgi:L-threonylcarbamoyladenylate synthase|nr:Sua5/YciO/YrdC/YwlC family protein [Tannerella sp.]
MKEIKLEFEITENNLTPGGEVPFSYKEMIRAHLFDKGLIICPSDTCYSVAAMCNFTDIGDILNIILERKDMPFSIAVDNVKMAEEYMDKDDKVALMLLEHFAPGPITCISEIEEHKEDFCKIIHSQKDGTVGVRIPDSSIERAVASFANCAITTVPVRMGESPQIRKYEDAISFIIKRVQKKSYKFDKPIKLAGIKANIPFSNKLSTVVRIENVLKQLQIVRAGYITNEKLNDFIVKNRLYGWKVVSGII